VINNPLHILRKLDGHLRAPFDLYVYGRAALALGFVDAPARFQATMDVDAILPTKDILALEQNLDFWDAQRVTNEEMADSGLFFTHLFEDRQVILTPDWLDQVVALTGFDFARLRLFRPSTVDLVLTKMMRVDPEDRDDIRFLVAQEDCERNALNAALDRAVVPLVAEIQEAFARNRAWLKDAGLLDAI
jgi:hypothetical protein